MLNHYTDMLISWLEHLSETVPPFIFIAVGSFIEEIISIIPSPLVMTLAGTILEEQGRSHFYIIAAAIVGSLVKTIASYVLYFFADKLEDYLPQSLLKIIGFDHQSLEAYGKKLHQSRHINLLLVTLRVIPTIPSLPVSVAAGILKIHLPTYFVTTFIGFIFRGLIYLYIGYYGIEFLSENRTPLTIASILVTIAFIAYLYYRNKQPATQS